MITSSPRSAASISSDRRFLASNTPTFTVPLLASLLARV